MSARTNAEKARAMLAYYQACGQALADALEALPDDGLTIGEQLHVLASILGHAVAENCAPGDDGRVIDLLCEAMAHACAAGRARPLPKAGVA